MSPAFDTPGTFHYVCEQHAPDMEGTVTVIASQTGPARRRRHPAAEARSRRPRRARTRPAPVISRFDMTRARFRVRRGASAFVFRISEPVDVRIAISRVREAARQDALRAEGHAGPHASCGARARRSPSAEGLRAARPGRGPLPRAPSRPPTPAGQPLGREAHVVPDRQPLSAQHFAAALQCRAACARRSLIVLAGSLAVAMLAAGAAAARRGRRRARLAVPARARRRTPA